MLVQPYYPFHPIQQIRNTYDIKDRKKMLKIHSLKFEVQSFVHENESPTK